MLRLSIGFFLLIVSGSALSALQTVVKAQSYLDVASGKLVSPAVILINDGKILAVNPSVVPDDARVIDLGDRILLPGVIDAHSHLTIDYFTGDHWVTAPVMETARIGHCTA